MSSAIFCTIPKGEIKISRSKPECHRRYVPRYEKPMANIPILKRIDAILDKWNPNKCKHVINLRRNGGSILMRVYTDGSRRYKQLLPRRLKMRTEREQTMRCLVRAILNNTEYSPSAKYVLECMASIEQLARMIGQLHEYESGYDDTVNDNDEVVPGHYRHGRTSCDPVRGALDDLEAAGLLIIVRDYDKENKTYKASRIFSTPKLFQSLGMRPKETRTLLLNKDKSANNKGKQYKRQKPVLSTMASINNNKLISLLDFNKRYLLDEFSGKEGEERRKEAKLKHEQIDQNGLTPDQKVTLEYNQITPNYPKFQRMLIEEEISKSNPGLTKVELMRLVIQRLKH